VKQGSVNITRVELMPFWYTRAQWQLQYPKDVVYKMDVTWSKIKKSAAPDILMKSFLVGQLQKRRFARRKMQGSWELRIRSNRA
jgi:hypothetical protein